MLIPSLYATSLRTRSLRPVRFLVTKILGGDSKEPNKKNNKKKILPVEPAMDEFEKKKKFGVRQNGDSTGDLVD